MSKNQALSNRKKIINDPVYGFITVPFPICLDIIDHPWFQRLRRIKQLGLTNLVYPGANHTRFHHAIGAMHLMTQALNNIKQKGHEISDEEFEGAVLAILLHDIGHGPFSHALEKTILNDVHHEEVSLQAMKLLNQQFNGKLNTAIKIFTNRHPKVFLHQLVSSQLDMDRLDYLKRDSFFTGVSEGIVSSSRLISMLNVKDQHLVLEEKGIYSIEKFIVARRLMYWQVYMHKTVVAAEFMLVHLLKRAKSLIKSGHDIWCCPNLEFFLHGDFTLDEIMQSEEIFDRLMMLDDDDINASLKEWQKSDDSVLSYLSKNLLNRRIHKVQVLKTPASEQTLVQLEKLIASKMNLKTEDAKELLIHEMMANQAYTKQRSQIKILQKDGSTCNLEVLADNLNLPVLSVPVKKFFLAIPQEIV